MEFIKSILSHWFTWGLILGLIFTGISMWNHWKTRMEFRRYRRLLSDKFELEADHYTKLKHERETLASENENLRLKVGNTKDQPAKELERELEIYARAEKMMMINAPGFAAAWETAKSKAMQELSEEERGKSLPQRIFKKLRGGTAETAKHPDYREESTSKKDSNENGEREFIKENSSAN